MPAFDLSAGAAYVVITAITGTIYTILVWCIRIFVRTKINKPFAWDDMHCTIATAFTVLNASLILSQTGYGLGHHASALSPPAANIQRILGWLAVICYIQASAFSILSVAFLLVRVTRYTSRVRPAYLVAGATGLWCLTSTTIVLFQCRLPAPWRSRPHSRCIDIYSAWVFINAARACLEFANVVVASWLLWKLKMPARPKVVIIALFTLRLLVIPSELTRLHYIEISWQAADWSYARINVQILTQVTMHISTMLATVPCVKNFLLVFQSGNLHPPTQPYAHAQTATATATAASTRRISQRRSDPSTFRPRPPLSSPHINLTPSASRRAHSTLDIRTSPHPAAVVTALRPGPMHTLRMHSWSAPESLALGAPGTPSRRTLSTAEHDPEDARNAALERRRSDDSEGSRRRVMRTRSVILDWRGGVVAAVSGGGSGEGVGMALRRSEESEGEVRVGVGGRRRWRLGRVPYRRGS